MVDPNRIQGDVNPIYSPEQAKEADQVDPEKFKKVLKVDESEESHKRDKRRLKKQEEEGEEEENVKEAPTPSPATSFSQFMDDSESTSILDPGKGTAAMRTTPTSSSPYKSVFGSTDLSDIEDNEDEQPQTVSQESTTSTSNQNAQSFTDDSSSSLSYTPEEETFSYEVPAASIPSDVITTPTSETTEDMITEPQSQTDQSNTESKKETDSSLLSSQTKKGALKTKKKTKQPGLSPTQQPIESSTNKQAPLAGDKTSIADLDTDTKIKYPQQGVSTSTTETPFKQQPFDQEQATSLVDQSEQATPLVFQPLTPHQAREKKLQHVEAQDKASPQIPIEAPTSTNMEMMGDKDKQSPFQSEFPEATNQNASISLPSLSAILSAVTPPDTTACSKLSPQVYELFEKMAGVITIADHSGIERTTMTINMPNSVFQGAEVIIDRYSTAPNAFNIQLTGSPEAVKVFDAHLANLTSAFLQGGFTFEANVLKPVLQTKKHLIRRKSAPGNKK